MITLAATNTFKGKAGTATAITYTISGDSVNAGVDTFQILGQGQLAGSTGDLLTTTPVPSSTVYLIKEIELTNTTGSNVTGVTFYINGTTSANMAWQGSIPANGSATYSDSGWRIMDSNGVVQSVGSTGPSGTITVGTVTNIGTSGPPTVVNAGTSTAAVFNFGLQQGATGSTGAPGAVNTIASANSTIAVTGTTNTNLERAALTGDVTASAGSNATTLAAGSASNLNSGTLLAARMPALTGDTTSSANSVATTNVKLQGQAVSATTPAVGQVLEYGPSSTWTPSTMYFNVVNFGADPSNAADSTTAINAAVTAASANGFTGATGGKVWFPAGRYKITSTIVITSNNITLMGVGGGGSEDFGNYYSALGSHLVPTGAFKAVQVLPVQTAGLSGQANYGFKWKGLGIDNYAAAGTIGLQLISCQNFDIDDFYVINPTSVGLDFNTLPGATLNGALAFPLAAATITVNSTAASGTGPAFPANTNTAGSIVVTSGTGSTTPGQKILVTYTGGTGTTFTGCSSAGLGTGTFATVASTVQILPGAQDCTRGRVGQVNVRALDGGGAAGHGIQMNGDLGGLANTNLINWVGPIKIFHSNGNGINDINSDTNYFDVGTIQRTGGTGAGVMVGAGAANTFASRNNVFNHWSFGAGGFLARGTPTATFPSGPTRVMNYQLANGEALPTVEAGALLEVNFNGCFKVGNLTAPSVAAQVLTAATVNQLNNSKFVVPPQGFQVGTHLMWTIPLNKTGVAGGLSWLFNIRYGTGAVSTGAILQTVTYTATAVADGGVLELHCIINALGTGTSATNTGYAILRHDLAATGLATGITAPVSDVTSPAGFVYTRPTFAGFDSTLPASGTPQFISVEINPVTASTVMNTQPGVQAFCLAQSNF